MRTAFLTAVSLIAVFSSTVFARASVAPRNVTAESTFDAGILQVERFGRRDARALIFVPALFCGSWEWNRQIDALSKRYDVLVMTLPGFGGRRFIGSDDLMRRAAVSLHGLIVDKRLVRPVLIGHSLGGTLSIYFAERYPRDLSALVSVEGGYPAASTQAQRDASVAKSVAPYRGLPQNRVGEVVAKTTLQYTITSKSDVAAVQRLAADSDRDAIVAWMRAALPLDLTPGLAKITIPFTAIVPFDSIIDPYQGFPTEEKKRAAYVAWAARAPYGRVIMIDRSRHFVMFDRPEEFERALEVAISR
jgi:pimeloyl-ACP methyl ester carboxylesterase